MRFRNGLAMTAVLVGLAGVAGNAAWAEEEPVTGVSAPEHSTASVRGLAGDALKRLAGERGIDSLSVTWPKSRPVPRRVSGMEWSGEGTAREVAARFSREFGDLLGVAAGDLAWVRDEKIKGRTAVHFRQEWNGLPVSGGKVVVVVADSGKVLACSSGAQPVLARPAEGDIGRDAAVEAAVSSLGNAAELGKAVPVVTGKLVIAAPDRTQIVYRVLLPTIPGLAKLVVLVDAATGTVVRKFNDVRR